MKRSLSLAVALLVSSSAIAQSSPAFQAPIPNQQANVVAQSSGMSPNAELLFMVEQLQQEVQSLRGIVEEQTYQIKQLKKQGRDRYRDLDQRLMQLKQGNDPSVSAANASNAKSVSAKKSVVTAAAAEAVTPAVSSSAAVPVVKSEPASSPSAEQKRAYEQAYDLIKQKKYDQAVDKLHDFIARYPNSDLAGNAYYWLGEVYLVMPKYEQARQAFTVVVGSFSTHRKAPDAMFKLGVAYDKLGNADQSTFYLNEVSKRFPSSTAAKLAKDYKAK